MKEIGNKQRGIKVSKNLQTIIKIIIKIVIRNNMSMYKKKQIFENQKSVKIREN